MKREAVLAAGGVVVRETPGGPEVLVVHRPRYDDWSLPKGKLDRGESFEQAALREVAEETGLTCLLARELSPVAYRDGKGRPKQVRYWLMHPVAGDVRDRQPDREIDGIRWLDPARAREILTHAHDRALLDEI